MVGLPPGQAPGFKPLDPLRLALIAVAIPAASLILALFVSIVAMQAAGFGNADEIITRIGEGSGDPGMEVAVECSSLLFELLLLAFTLAAALRREQAWTARVPAAFEDRMGAAPGPRWPRTARILAWVPWPKDRSFLPFLVLMLFWQAVEGLLIEPRFPQLAQFSQLPQSQPAVLLSLLTVIVVAPVAEEVFFRGFLFTNMRAHAGFAATIIVTSIYFSLMHYEESFVFPLLTLPFGLVAGLARERYGSVRPAIYLHAIWNLIAWGTEYFFAASR